MPASSPPGAAYRQPLIWLSLVCFHVALIWTEPSAAKDREESHVWKSTLSIVLLMTAWAATFPLQHVIPGWTEALQLMSVGSTYRPFRPSELAYGEQGGGLMIGPNAVLIFEVELLEIE